MTTAISTTHTIDARNKRLGRIATEAAHLLMGKGSPDFSRHQTANVTVRIVNASRLLFSDKKKTGKRYTHYSGYPGGLTAIDLKMMLAKRGPEEVVRRAVRGMLPNNKLRARALKRLVITA